jgi:hypothetical protein
MHIQEDLPCHRRAARVQPSLSMSREHKPSIEAGLPDPRAQGSVRACCAAFALGSASGTACPASYARLDTAVACKSAADAARKAYTDVAYSIYPYGCYWHTITGSVYYNYNAAGAANRFAQPLCAGAALHAHAPRRTLRSRLARCDRGRRQVRRQQRRRSALQTVCLTVGRARSAAAARGAAVAWAACTIYRYGHDQRCGTQRHASAGACTVTCTYCACTRPRHVLRTQ